MGRTAPYNEHLGVQATSGQGHSSGLPSHSPAQCQEPTRGALLQGDGRASPSDGNLCSLLHLGRPQLKQERQRTVWLVATERSSDSGADPPERGNHPRPVWLLIPIAQCSTNIFYLSNKDGLMLLK